MPMICRAVIISFLSLLRGRAMSSMKAWIWACLIFVRMQFFVSVISFATLSAPIISAL